MAEAIGDEAQRQRVLECWLPLAQQVIKNRGVSYTPAELEALVLASANDLVNADSATTARAVLWTQHVRNRSTSR